MEWSVSGGRQRTNTGYCSEHTQTHTDTNTSTHQNQTRATDGRLQDTSEHVHTFNRRPSRSSHFNQHATAAASSLFIRVEIAQWATTVGHSGPQWATTIMAAVMSAQ